MQTVDLDNLSFQFGGSHPAFAGTEHYEEPKLLAFATSLDLLTHLAADDSHQTPIQNHVQSRLSEDLVVKEWHKQRTPIGVQPHFKRYRTNSHYEDYHEAARALVSMTASITQASLAQGLDAEITASRIIVPAGQVVFHGRADHGLHSEATYPSFVSTSLDPTVSIYHAVKRGIASKTRPVVYQLTLRDDLPAIWGNGGSLDEWELLLQSGLACAVSQIHNGSRFDIIEASIGR